MRVGLLTSAFLGLMAGSLLVASDKAWAQSTTATEPPIIGALRIEGIENIQLDGLIAKMETFVGLEADGETLKQLAGIVTNEAKDRGYIFASVSVPPQSVRIGIVTVNFDPGIIDDVRINGSANGHLKTILAPLKGAPGEKSSVERQLLLVEDLPGISVKNTRYVKEDGRGILIVDVAEDRIEGNLAIDNWGSENYGPIRLRGNAQINRLLSRADSVSVSATTTPAQPKELSYLSGAYITPIGSGGATVSVSGGVGKTQPGGQPNGLKVVGDSRSAALTVRTPLKRTVDSSLWISGEMAYLDVDQKLLDNWIQQDTTTSLTLNFSGSHALAGGRLSWGLGYVRGLDMFGASHAGDPLLSRRDGSGLFSKQQLWFNWFGDIGGGMSVRIAGTAQHASRGLLSAHELTYGGAFFGKGYDFAEISGDDGLLGLIELRRDLKLPWSSVKWAHLYGFVDGAWLDNKDDLITAGSLFSAGLGARAGVGSVEIGIEGAMPLKQAPYGNDDLKPRFNFILGYGL